MIEEPQPGQDVPTAPHPALNAMLICDLAIREEGSGKVSLIGIFENISASQFPIQQGLCVYAKLVDAEGEYQFRLELVRLEDLQILGQGEFRVAFADRMTPAEIIFNLGVGFDRPGRYEFRLHANNKWVASKSLSVVQMAPPGAS
ncbi:MAG: hypothetical protein HYT85_11895 [candidate division NC10 bacterium]|nr:hypothetical protein [candidate division NC10 bacterium]MBI2454976.1 hypothetical protein [candidate division NC10 bacterium]